MPLISWSQWGFAHIQNFCLSVNNLFHTYYSVNIVFLVRPKEGRISLNNHFAIKSHMVSHISKLPCQCQEGFMVFERSSDALVLQLIWSVQWQDVSKQNPQEAAYNGVSSLISGWNCTLSKSSILLPSLAVLIFVHLWAGTFPLESSRVFIVFLNVIIGN